LLCLALSPLGHALGENEPHAAGFVRIDGLGLGLGVAGYPDVLGAMSFVTVSSTDLGFPRSKDDTAKGPPANLGFYIAPSFRWKGLIGYAAGGFLLLGDHQDRNANRRGKFTGELGFGANAGMLWFTTGWNFHTRGIGVTLGFGT